ncbi:response regulator transcription factor [Neomicrococcus aestuarii]|uniref:HTH luxR-type domain-containing protein n=1 Tax=Neomicrococcus aestuarii TaxID=556325 RepID=A0A1L2ZP06_9MICC|nr:response regulator transcription factor [Neomicrococcus aestuarii]APF40751.1 hypothetical protein BHE16_06720 [Neomicrococcus aestuarii]
MATVDVIISSKDTLLSSALAQLINSTGEFTATPTKTRDALQLHRELRAAEVNLLIVASDSEEQETAQLIRDLSHHSLETRAIAVVSSPSPALAALMYGAGARGVVGSDASPCELYTALREVQDGHFSASRSVLRTVCDFVRAAPPPEMSAKLSPAEKLSAREHAVVCLLTKGMTNSEIARELFIAEPTVKAHLGRVMNKWKVRDRVQVVIRALETKIVEFPENSIRMDPDSLREASAFAQHPSNTYRHLHRVPS